LAAIENGADVLRKIFKKIGAFALALTMALPLATAFADDYILVDGRREFTGRSNAPVLIRSANFGDLGALWPAEAVVRGVAFGAIHAEGANFNHEQNLTRQDALNAVMRAVGLSGAAVARGNELVLGGFTTAQAMINSGYSTLATEMDIIPAGWPLFGQATRQEVAFLLYSAVQAVASGHFSENVTMQTIYTFGDWQTIGSEYLVAVENLASANVMNGDGVNFNPTAPITRGQMAQVLSNLDQILLSINGLERRLGTVAGIRDADQPGTAAGSWWRNISVRLGDGTVDVLQYQVNTGPSPQTLGADAVVFAGGTVGGLGLLSVDDTIEYFVHPADGTVWYVNVLHAAVEEVVTGTLFSLYQQNMEVTLMMGAGNRRIFPLIDGIVNTVGGNHYLTIDGQRQNIATLPFGQNVRLYLRNNVVIRMSFVGMPVLVDELRGLVVENNPAFGYMVVVDESGRRVTMRYYEQEMMVQRISHFDQTMHTSYISQLFPSFAFNPLATTIGQIRPGDIVFIRGDEVEPNVISMISAISNYIMRYGRIASIVHHEGYMSVLFEQENGQTTWLEVANDTFITREGRRISPMTIQVGDWVRLLVNEAVLAPGHMISSVIEMTIEGVARHITGIVRGNLSGINAVQNIMMVEHAQSLSQVGWTDFREVGQFSLANPSISYFYNNRRITQQEALRLFGFGSATVYIALENHFAGERVAMVSFRSQREERLPADTVVRADGAGNIWLASSTDPIATDSGTIVRRNGRLVTGADIMPGDHATVVLSGAGRAAVVDIAPAPDTSALQIFRVRVSRVWDGQSFRVTSMSQLIGTNWVFTPLEREFEIDTRTIFMGGEHDINSFITYLDTSVFNQVFTIVADGARATHVITQPFANRAVRGTVINDVNQGDDSLMLRDVLMQDPATGRWNPISMVNNTMTIRFGYDTVIGRNNAIVPQRYLQAGDRLLVMTEIFFVGASDDDPTMGEAYGRIILVQ